MDEAKPKRIPRQKPPSREAVIAYLEKVYGIQNPTDQEIKQVQEAFYSSVMRNQND